MKIRVYFLLLASCAPLGWAQTSSSGSASSATTGQPGQLKTRGPETVATQDPNRIVATMNGQKVTAKQAADMLKPIRPEDRKRYANNLPMLLQQVYMQQQFADEGAKLALDQREPWKEQLRIARDNVLAQAYIQQISNQGGALPDDPKHYYESHPSEFEQMKVSGIFLAFGSSATPGATPGKQPRTEEQAKSKADELEGKIKGGGDFATLAKANSDNQASAARGGEIGTFTLADANLPADIKNALGTLQPGQVSQPLRQASGYYILKVDNKTKQPYDQAQGSIMQKWQTERGQAALKEQFTKYKIQVQDPSFFDGQTGAPPKIPSLAQPGTTAPHSNK